MITIFANSADAYVSQYKTLTSGRNGMSALLLLKREHWEGLNVLVNFLTSDGTTRSAIFEPLVDFEHTQCDLSGYIPGVAVIPAKVLETAGVHLLAGVKGSNSDGTVVIPTIYCDLGEVQIGASVDGEIDQVEDGREIIELALDTAEEALTKAELALEEIEHGAMAPTVTMTPLPNNAGTHLCITDKDGDHECNIYNGEDGVSPLITVTALPLSAGYLIEITDATSTKTITLYNGAPGQDGSSVTCATQSVTGGTQVTLSDKNGDHTFTVYDGSDGTSPTVSITQITDGYTITISDATGDHTATIYNGSDGTSPSVSITELSDHSGYTLSITDATGTHSATILNGSSVTAQITSIQGGHRLSVTDKNGTYTCDIMDGVSPTISSSVITGGHRLTIVDASGTTTVDVMDGDGGATFTPAVDANGNISWTNDKQLPNPQTQNIKGPAGPGVPSGGTQGQFLIKQSSTDYDAAWVTLSTWQGGSY